MTTINRVSAIRFRNAPATGRGAPGRAAVFALLLAGCHSVPMLPSLAPHKIDIQQGNLVSQDMVAKLKPGMTRSQVRFALGTPLIVDPFHDERWDYAYVYWKGGVIKERRRVTAVFDGDKLLRVEGDVVASTRSADSRPPESAAGQSAPPATPDVKP